MRKILFIFLIFCVCYGEEFLLDKSHSKVSFVAKNLLVFSVNGGFDSFDARALYDEKSDAFESFYGVVNVASIDTKNATRNKELVKDGYFFAQKYPQAIFMMDKYSKINDKNAQMCGILNINGIEKNICFDIENYSTVSITGQTKLGFKMHTKINRKDFDIGVFKNFFTIGYEVDIFIYAEMYHTH